MTKEGFVNDHHPRQHQRLRRSSTHLLLQNLLYTIEFVYYYIVYEIVPICHLMNNKVHPSFYTVLIKVGQNVITGEMIFYTLPVIHICVTLYPVLQQI